jgi:hypothetical protein
MMVSSGSGERQRNAIELFPKVLIVREKNALPRSCAAVHECLIG